MSNRASSESVLDTLVAELAGSLIRPGHAEWDAHRTPWNFAVDQRPAAVAVPRDAADLGRILAAARADGLGVAVQPRGHGANGDVADCILVRTSAFNEVSIDTGRRIARVGAGVRWGTLLPRLEGTSLIALAGTNPDVTVAGYLLSGGHSWFSRRHGLAAHSMPSNSSMPAGKRAGSPRRATPNSSARCAAAACSASSRRWRSRCTRPRRSSAARSSSPGRPARRSSSGSRRSCRAPRPR